MPREKLTEVERFWKNVERGDDDDACWLWHGSISNGYGTIHAGGSNRVAHAVIYEWYIGPIPKGMELDHLCRHRNCVNPRHLEPVTRQENVRRALVANGYIPEPALQSRIMPAIPERRIPARCKRGHPLTEDNLSWQEVHTGARNFVRWRCKTCQRAKTQRYRDAIVQEERVLLVPPQTCAHGHTLEGENLRLAKTGWVCVECQRAAGRRAYHKKVREPKLLPPKPDFCINGHAMQGDNVAKNVTGWVCVTCRRAAGLRAYYKKKAMEE